MRAAIDGYTDCVIELIRAKANIHHKANVRVGLAGCMVVCVHWSQGGDVEGVSL